MDERCFDIDCDFDKVATENDGVVSRDVMEDIERNAVERIRSWLRKDTIDQDKVAIATSMGMDSVVVGHLANRAGVKKYVMVYTLCAYPQHIGYARDYMNDIDGELYEKYIEWWDNEWIFNNRDFLFPKGEWGDELNKERQLQHQDEFIRNHDLDMLIFGRRLSDNMVWRQIQRRFNVKEEGVMVSAFPIINWDFEHVLSYMEYHNIKPSPIYRMKYSTVEGGGDNPWHKRPPKEAQDSKWYSVYEMAPRKMWKEIVGYFPQGHSQAWNYARRQNKNYDFEEDQAIPPENQSKEDYL
jgi:3'-phosphoadenosine 5'-phosphosulfate sulfotransferase (PAPS reductase)/FAD synthetase